MKVMHSLVLLVIMVTVFVFPSAQGYAAPIQSGTSFHATSNQVVQVWFDSPPQLTASYPPAYLFNVVAKTSSGLSITNLHWDFGDGSTLDLPFSGQSQISEQRAHQYPNQVNYCVSVTAYDNAGNSGTAAVSLMPSSDFTLTPISPSTQNISQGMSAAYTVRVDSLPSCSPVQVTLTTSLSQNLPAGVNGTLNPSSASTPFTFILTVQTTTSTPKGTYTIDIIGTSASITHVVTVNLIVNVPYFTITPYPTSLFVPAQPPAQSERTNTTTVTIQSFNNFNSPVILTSSGKPNGTSASFSSTTVTPSPNGVGKSILTIITPCSVTPGSYTIIITGTSGSQVRQANVNITVSACPAKGDNLWIVLGLLALLFAVVLIFVLLRRNRTTMAPAVIYAPIPPTPVPPQVLYVQPLSHCTMCGNPMVFLEQYQRWYCSNCQTYA